MGWIKFEKGWYLWVYSQHPVIPSPFAEKLRGRPAIQEDFAPCALGRGTPLTLSVVAASSWRSNSLLDPRHG